MRTTALLGKDPVVQSGILLEATLMTTISQEVNTCYSKRGMLVVPSLMPTDCAQCDIEEVSYITVKPCWSPRLIYQ